MIEPIELKSAHLRNDYRDFLKEAGLTDEKIANELKGTQAHHIIPIQVANSLLENGLISTNEYNQFDNNWNFMLLPNSYGDPANTVVHRGSHPDYSKWIESLIHSQDTKVSTFLNSQTVAGLVSMQILEIYQSSFQSLNINNLQEFLNWIFGKFE